MILFNNIPATEIMFENPRSGQWTADLKFINLSSDQQNQLRVGLKSKLQIDYEDQSWVGSIVSINYVYPYINIRVIGGDGRMDLPTKAKQNKAGNADQATNGITDDTNTPKPSTETSSQPSYTVDLPAAPTNLQNFLKDKVKNAGSERVKVQAALLYNYIEKRNAALEERLKETYAARYKQNQELEQQTVLNQIRGTSIQGFQKLDGVDSGKQLRKTLQDKTKNPSTTWRINRDGDLVYVTDSNPEVKSVLPTKAFLLASSENTISFQTNDLDYYPEPGSWFVDDTTEDENGNVKVFRVEHVRLFANAEKIILKVFQNSMNNTVRSIVSKKEEESFQKNYSAQIHRQNSDGTLDLLPDDDLIKGTGLSNIPIRSPLGFSFTGIPEGARAVVQYENNDPSKPYVVGFVELTSSQHSESYNVIIGNPNAAEFVALANKVLTEIQRLYDTFTDPSVVPAPASGPDAGEPGLLALQTVAAANKALIETMASTKLKVE